MSGSSFDYLYMAFGDDLLAKFARLREMRDKMRSRYFDSAAYKATQLATDAIEAVIKALDEDELLRNVWQAVEWETSGDWDEEQVYETVREYEEHHASNEPARTQADQPSPPSSLTEVVLDSIARILKHAEPDATLTADDILFLTTSVAAIRSGSHFIVARRSPQ